MKTSMKLTGIEDYLQTIRQAGLDVDAAVDKALAESSSMVHDEVVSRAAEAAPGTSDDPGRLKRDIYMTQPASEGNYHFVEIGVPVEKVPEALPNEYGTSKMPAQPFFRPAFRNMRHRWLNAMKASLKSFGVE